MADRKAPGEATSERLSARADSGLVSRRMSDGGEVYTGSLARRALRSVGARAMTVEGGDIVVDSDFDPSRSQDAALYAHERIHQKGSGGDGGGAAGHTDAEEQAARAIEAMVLHRMESGEDLNTVLRDVTLGKAADLAKNATTGSGSPVSQLVERALQQGVRPEDPMFAYLAERAKGKPHKEIVDDLARFVVRRIEDEDSERRFRSAE